MPVSTPPAWNIVSLRPSGRHDGLRAAARRRGGGLIALSTCRITREDDPAIRAVLARAMDAYATLFTSPEAVRAAAALLPLPAGLRAVAVGAGTAAALRRAGVAGVVHPARMDSEGLLDLPVLRGVSGRRLGLVTAPGGRGILMPALQDRGARVLRANVYRRHPIQPARAAVARLLSDATPAVVALSSAEALATALATLPPEAARRLRALPAVAASARLAARAAGLGFTRVQVAEGPRPAQLATAALSMLQHPASPARPHAAATTIR